MPAGADVITPGAGASLVSGATSVLGPHDPQLQAAWQVLDCALPAVRPIFDACAHEAMTRLSPEALQAYWLGGRQLGKLGRGAAPVLAWLTYWPEVVEAVQAAKVMDKTAVSHTQEAVMALLLRMHKSPNSAAMAPLITSLGPVAQRLAGPDLLAGYLQTVGHFMDRTTGSIHGFHTTIPSPGLPDMLEQMPQLLRHLSVRGLGNWMDYGIRNYGKHPERQKEYFSLQSADSRAILQRERQIAERAQGKALRRCGRGVELCLREARKAARLQEVHA